MRLTYHKIHKYSGLIAGVFLFILGFTGFFLNHENWRFLHDTTLSFVPKNVIEKQVRGYVVYWQDSDNAKHIISGGKRGLFESFDGGKKYKRVLDETIFALREHGKDQYVATQNGIYERGGIDSDFKLFLLGGSCVNSMNIYKNYMVASVDKSQVLLYDFETKALKRYRDIEIDSSILRENITLSRLVRDIHYARGLFDGDISLWINDYGALTLSFLTISGFLLWWFIIQIKKDLSYRSKIIIWIKFHSNTLSLVALVPLVLLVVTGIFLDHAGGLRKFMKSITIQNSILPPVYHSLRVDIWGVDFDGNSFYIGNRYGVYKSKNLKNFELVSKGFAYKLIRLKDELYISGMGSKNRVLIDGKWKILPKTPHMFRDVFLVAGKPLYFSSSKNYRDKFVLPHFENATLYDIVLSLHDGSFFSSWWIWVNDFVSILFLVLGVTGFTRWKKRR